MVFIGKEDEEEMTSIPVFLPYETHMPGRRSP
jgi:hypothetical protein